MSRLFARIQRFSPESVMRFSTVITVAAVLFALAACSPAGLSSDTKVQLPPPSAANVPATTGEKFAKGEYTDYREGIIGNGRTSVLFFHAAWCPYCRAQDVALKALYASNGFPVSTYKVDYDSSTDLRVRYGVVQQHTFVVIDGQGNKTDEVTDASPDAAAKVLAKLQ